MHKYTNAQKHVQINKYADVGLQMFNVPKLHKYTNSMQKQLLIQVQRSLVAIIQVLLEYMVRMKT